jgi:RHS repeat-associated protein
VLAEETAAGDTHWALTDHQGSVSDNSGAALNHLVYNNFGQVTSKSDPTVDVRFGYTGRELDAETDLMYYRARYFDPAAGTFVSEDPLGFGAGDENLYRYVFNSPTNYVDPSGLETTIYIHTGGAWHGHSATNVNDTVYTFGRYGNYNPTSAGLKGDGILYAVPEDYYLNDPSFTGDTATVQRWSLDLSPEDEQAIVDFYEGLPGDNETIERRGRMIIAFSRLVRYNSYLLLFSNILIMKPHSIAFRQKIIEVHEAEDTSQRKLAKRFNVALSFIQKLLKQYRETDSLAPKVRTQQTPAKLNNEHLTVLRRLVEERNDATLEELRKQLIHETGIDVSRSTIDRALNKLGLTLKKDVPC